MSLLGLGHRVGLGDVGPTNWGRLRVVTRAYAAPTSTTDFDQKLLCRLRRLSPGRYEIDGRRVTLRRGLLFCLIMGSALYVKATSLKARLNIQNFLTTATSGRGSAEIG